MFFLIPLAILVGALSAGVAVELTTDTPPQGPPASARPAASSAPRAR